jgi:hypothetical protein
MKRFCTKFSQPVNIEDINGTPMCTTSNPLGCEEKCKYSFAGATLSQILGSADPRFFDWTIELKGAPDEVSAKAKGSSKICDICIKPIYYEDAYLLHTDAILASDKYIDFVIHGWVKKGLLPSLVISGGISNETRAVARADIERQGGGTPWLVCKSCLSMFSLNEQDKVKAKKRASYFWEGENIEGVRTTIKSSTGKEPAKAAKKAMEKPAERKTVERTTPKKWWQFWK